MQKRIHVVAAVIYDQTQHKIFLAKRPSDKHQGGKWEFPGGKVETGESAEQALKRELFEEIGIQATHYTPLIQIRYDYPDKHILLDVWEVHQFSGNAHGKEGQFTEWATRSNIDAYTFPAANVPILKAIKQPSRCLITPDFSETPDFLSKLDKTLQNGIKLICFRAKNADATSYIDMAEKVIEQAGQYGAIVTLNSPPAFVAGEHGNHLTSHQLMQDLPRAGGLSAIITSASCHNVKELKRAEEIGVEFAFLSPVLKTQSHPDNKPMGWKDFQTLVSNVNTPVYALGGLGNDEITTAKQHGAQGVAAISGFWES
ncbi:MAG: Mutator mutT protein (7,8-dihydro-8-oxoguanine-triphosphatase) (EC [uncultured Thiotrichaceae bacterium]|uniref:8-oxo-dGTP diphosphatase n=1 Tax=uncultured Thiotrichaceae bacterium TaxID=298394 RepID=A0A6S6SGM1_9GAMM|nr:MAG: Mutator mutT protein (7,8-dihydro-8-oxoguanine-triphosphatase) (EC [uncultured Thiotrichaceae bacterium]